MTMRYPTFAEACMKEAAGSLVYRGVPLLGEYSPNGGVEPYHTGRDYSEVIRLPETAAAMEGAPYLMGHSGRDSVMPTDVIGVVENVRYGKAPNGRNYLLGDVRLFEGNAGAAHAMKLIEAMPGRVGSSVEFNEGSYTLEKRGADTIMRFQRIPKFRGVSFVVDPATTKGFYESQEATTTMDQKPESISANMLALYTEAVASLKTNEATLATITGERDALKARVAALEVELDGLRKGDAIIAEAAKRKLTLTEAELGVAKALPKEAIPAYLESLTARTPQSAPGQVFPYGVGSPLIAGAVSSTAGIDPLDHFARSIVGGGR